MNNIVQLFEQEVMSLSQSLLWNLIRAPKAERLFLILQVCSEDVPTNTFEQPSKVQSKPHFKLLLNSPF